MMFDIEPVGVVVVREDALSCLHEGLLYARAVFGAEVVVQGVVLKLLVTEDIRVKGSFRSDAPSDLDYFGYRETEFEVLSAVDEYDLILTEQDLDLFMELHGLDVEAAIQKCLDKEQEECLLYDEPYDHGEDVYIVTSKNKLVCMSNSEWASIDYVTKEIV